VIEWPATAGPTRTECGLCLKGVSLVALLHIVSSQEGRVRESVDLSAAASTVAGLLALRGCTGS
jgi:hypothetical protein